MEYEMNSGLLHAAQPCLYHEFQDYLYGIEQEETEYREERADEIVQIPEEGQPWLVMLPDEIQKDVACTAIRRRNLPEGHPEYQGPEECNLDWDKAKEIISRCWLETLEEWIADRYRTEGVEDGIQVSFKGTYSPREYNFGGDECNFLLSASLGQLGHIVETCLTDYREGFAAYLKRAHSSYDGYWSWVSNDINDHDRYWESVKAGVESDFRNRVEHVVWACLDFWLFGIEDMESGDTNKLDADAMEKRFGKNQDIFRNSLWDKVTDAQGNGVFYEIMEYKPMEAEAV